MLITTAKKYFHTFSVQYSEISKKSTVSQAVNVKKPLLF